MIFVNIFLQFLYLREIQFIINPAMQINVVNIIIDSLLANGKCSIDGLGTFILNKDLPKVDPKLKKINGPQSSITFEDTIHEDYKLKDELLRVYPFSEEKSKKVVNLFANKVVNGLINFDDVQLSNLGTLKNNKSKSGLEFTISPLLKDVIDASQPDVNLEPFIAAKEEAEKKANLEAEKAEKLKQQKKKEEAERKAKAEALRQKTEAAKATPIAPKVKAPNQVNPVKPISETGAKETVVPVGSQVVDSPVPTNSVAKPKENTIAPSSVKEKEVFIHQDDEGFFSKYLPWILFLLLIVGLAWGIKKIINSISIDSDDTELVIGDETSDTTEDVAVTDDTVPSDGDTNSTDGEGTEGIATGSEASAKEKPMQPSECIIITGSYHDQQNMDEMASKIRKMGYEVYTEKYGYYTRVGFEFPCEDVNLKLFIEKIRANISKESWYLVPDLSI